MSEVASPVKRFGFLGAGRVAMEKLRNEVLGKLLLRRTKAERKLDIRLPRLTVSTRRVALQAEERDIYEAIFSKSRTEFDTYVAMGTLLPNFAHIFSLIQQLRQAADHPYLATHRSRRSFRIFAAGQLPAPAPAPAPAQAPAVTLPGAARGLSQEEEAVSEGQGHGQGRVEEQDDEEEEDDSCTLCQGDVDEHSARLGQCGHVFHRRCLAQYLAEVPKLSSGFVSCPACFSPLSADDASTQSSEGPQELSELEEPDLDTKDTKDTCGSSGFRPNPEPDAVPAASSDLGPDPGDRPESQIQAQEEAERVPPAVERPAGEETTQEELPFRTSSKVEALVEALQKMLRSNQTSKALVYSQFVRFLQLIDWRLQREGLQALFFEGSLQARAKNSVSVKFQTQASPRILLISLMAGSEALNLQAADHVFLMDPWWNPACELQAIQRAHRIGQTRPVVVTRFVAEKTIEEQIVKLQERKQAIFDCTIGGSYQGLHRLTAEDLGFLFDTPQPHA